MSTANNQNELDDRFSTGDWDGFYIQPDGNQRYAMNCHLQFTQGSISGGGDDIVGEFAIQGMYDLGSGNCTWSKSYLGQHSVSYAGQARNGGIVGHWQIRGAPDFWTGPFFLWPRALGNLESAFERAFMAYEFSKSTMEEISPA